MGRSFPVMAGNSRPSFVFTGLRELNSVWKKAIYLSVASFIISIVLCVAGIVCTSLRSSASTAAFAVSRRCSSNTFRSNSFYSPAGGLFARCSDQRHRFLAILSRTSWPRGWRTTGMYVSRDFAPRFRHRHHCEGRRGCHLTAGSR